MLDGRPRRCKTRGGARSRARRAFPSGISKRSAPDTGFDFGEPQRQPLADRIFVARLLADQLLGGLVVAEIFAAQVAHRHQPVAADPVDRREEAEIGHAGDPHLAQFADALGQIGGDIAVDRVALGLHRAAFEPADRLADPLHPRRLVGVSPPGPRL